MAVDPWTIGLKQDHPDIYARLEKFLDECARIAGHERAPEQPYREFHANYTVGLEPWKKSINRRAKRQRLLSDVRNRVLLHQMLDLGKRPDEVLIENGLACPDSMTESMEKTLRRNGYNGGEAIFAEYRKVAEWRYQTDKNTQRYTKPIKQERHFKVFDALTLDEVQND